MLNVNRIPNPLSQAGVTQLLRAGSTIMVIDPTWTGDGFGESTAQAYWEQFPDMLRAVALAELAAGNIVTQILRNHERGVVLLEFAVGPLAGPLPEALTVHRSHRLGNYCYDGTRCTVEDPSSGCFLAFLDPEWQEDV